MTAIFLVLLAACVGLSLWHHAAFDASASFSSPHLNATSVSSSSPYTNLTTSISTSSPKETNKYHPIVIWHGLGDSAFSEPMGQVRQLLEQTYPGIFVHLVSLAPDAGADQRAGIFGEVNEQVEQVCGQLAGVEELRDGFDAIGFSQGGQFLRAYVERCNAPPVRNLITFGSQHMGIADLPVCKPTDFLCRLAESALRAGVYTNYAQHHVVSAQYFRNPREEASFGDYIAKNAFLADINNERRINKDYVKRLASLEHFVMILFSEDTTVSPKESAWFASYPEPGEQRRNETQSSEARWSAARMVRGARRMGDRVTSEDQEQADGTDLDAPPLRTIPLRRSAIYKDDRLGLRAMDKRGALIFETCEGVHMEISRACRDKVFGRYVGIAPPSSKTHEVSPLSLSLGSWVVQPLRQLVNALWFYTLGVGGA